MQLFYKVYLSIFVSFVTYVFCIIKITTRMCNCLRFVRGGIVLFYWLYFAPSFRLDKESLT